MSDAPRASKAEVSTSNSRWTRPIGIMLGAIAATTICASCDPTHPSDDVQVKIYSAGDGRAAMSVLTPHQTSAAVSQDRLLLALVQRLAIGAPAGAAPVPPDVSFSGPSIELTGVDRTRLRVPISVVRDVMTEFHFPSDASVFVSVCTSARTGTASGTGVALVHNRSCAVWEPAPLEATELAAAELDFAPRPPPSRWLAALAVLLAVGGSLGVIAWASAASRRRRVRASIAVWAMVTASAVVAVVALIVSLRDDPWMDAGQTFDDAIVHRDHVVSGFSLFVGIVLPIAAMSVVRIGQWLSERRADRTDRAEDWATRPPL